MSNSNKTIIKIISIAFCALLAAGTAYGDSSKTIIKHRQGVMEAIGGHFGAAFSTMKGMDQFSGNQQFHAESIARLAKISVETFPAGSGKGKTKALPAIWEQPEVFKAAMDEFLLNADAFAVASTKDMATYGAAAQALGKSCKNCHDDFKDK
ncbi:cytochrome c [Oceanicoccus sp. KOV_DT_Chl]|uniref:c-type cytochrome n=1 Tax=Oceanicoccus sp. KOV_DT_Chl TaxID=1904639 RepID=UPI00135725D3|nr:cytochrome c [Oceanicoccus sp. KOV_DT_Chl]